jgi:hypothetical protein
MDGSFDFVDNRWFQVFLLLELLTKEAPVFENLQGTREICLNELTV